RTHTADLALNPAVPWDVDISSGVWRLRADLRGLRLGSFSVSSGTADMTLLLPPPEGTVPVRVSGGAHKLTIHRPPGAAARIRVGCGVQALTLETLHLSRGGEARWETPAFEAASGRYDVETDGGASQLVFDAALEAEDEPAGTPVPAGSAAAASGWAEALSAEEYPTLAPLAGRLANPDPDARFEFGLQVLLDGLEPRLRPHCAWHPRRDPADSLATVV